MIELFKTFRKYTLYFIAVIVLLFVQANCDLALPDYTSKIVNIGIQQNGIENAVPTVLRASEKNKILMFMDNPETFTNSYELITEESDDYDSYLKKYSVLEQENIYVLKSLSSEQLEKLNGEIALPLLIVYNMEQNQDKVLESMGNITLPEGTDLFTFLNSMSAEQRHQLITGIKEYTSKMEPSLIEQSATIYIKGEYEAVGINTKNVQLRYIFDAGIRMLGLALVSMIITIITVLAASRVAAFVGRDLRSKVVGKVMKFSNSEFEQFSTASLITRSTNDIQQIQMLIVMLLRIVIYAPIIGIGAFARVSNSSMGWIIGVAVLAISSLVIILFSVALPKFQKVQNLIDKLNLVSREILTGLPVIRAFATEKHEEKRFDRANNDLRKTNLFVNRVMTIMMPSMMFIMNGVSSLIIWVGASKIDAGTIQVGNLMAFITYTMQIIMAFLMISMVSIMIPRAFISMKRIAEIFNKKASIREKDSPMSFDKKQKGIVEFKDVYFRYPDAEEDVLSNISFKSLPGTTTAFIGSTGSGKSTLINLIPRFFDVTGGKILIDGINIKDAKLKELRAKIGFVPQKGNLFTGTIKSNIGFGLDNISNKQLEKAVRISQSKEFIDSKKDKYESAISQGGTNVSGGQRQRLAIARALAINPEILVFDDSFSALDYKTDVNLRAAIHKEIKDSTIFIVAQRISTILHADQIIVLDKGEVAGIGTHKELLKNCEVYKEIALSQLGEEELNNA